MLLVLQEHAETTNFYVITAIPSNIRCKLEFYVIISCVSVEVQIYLF